MNFIEKTIKNNQIKTVVHVGAHKGQEVPIYKKHGLKNIYLFEPQKPLFKILSEKYKQDESITVYNFALGNKSFDSEFFISNNEGASSSLLKAKEHLDLYPEINFESRQNVSVKPLSYFDIEKPELVVIDTQGYELKVLEGCGALLHKIDFLIIEINLKELYENSPLVKDIDNYLLKYKFIRSKTSIHSRKYFGDAVYVKRVSLNYFEYLFCYFKNHFMISNFYIKIINFVHLDYWKEKINNINNT